MYTIRSKDRLFGFTSIYQNKLSGFRLGRHKSPGCVRAFYIYRFSPFFFRSYGALSRDVLARTCRPLAALRYKSRGHYRRHLSEVKTNKLRRSAVGNVFLILANVRVLGERRGIRSLSISPGETISNKFAECTSSSTEIGVS